MNSFKPMLAELFWLTIAFIVTMLICSLVFHWDNWGTLDLQMHDTYIVFSAATIIAPIFLLVTFVLYFIKESRKRFSRKVPNIILLIAGLGLIPALSFVLKALVVLGTNYNGWTAYPPLSMLPESGPEGAELNLFAAVLTNVLIGLQIMVTGALLYAVFHWGRGTKENS
jgi:heme/copper-type cytochrome/quinol oxidase subunit 1